MGISGGKFQKTEMFKAITDNNDLNDFWAKHCKLSQTDVLSISVIPKPYEDVVDGYLIYKILEKQNSLN